MVSSDEIVTVPTGSTPKKTKYAALPPLCATRAHDIIKGEARANKTSSSDVNVDLEATCGLIERSVSENSLDSTSSNLPDHSMETEAHLEPINDDVASVASESDSKNVATKKRKATTVSVGTENANPQLDNSNRVYRSKSIDTVDSNASAEDVKNSSVPAKAPAAGVKKPVSKMPRSKRTTAN